MVIRRYIKKCKLAYLRIALLAIALSALFMPSLSPVKSVGDNIFTLYINGQVMGTVDDKDTAYDLMNEARRELAKDNEGMLFLEAKTELVGEEILFGQADDKAGVLDNIKNIYSNSVHDTLQHAYTVKIDGYMVNLPSISDVQKLLEASIERYDTQDRFSVLLMADSKRELPVQVPEINKNYEEEKKEELGVTTRDFFDNDGVFGAMDDVIDNIDFEKETDFDDYYYGITEMRFANTVEIVEAILPSRQVSNLNKAIDEVTKDKEKKKIYEVVSGDTLSGIANKTGITVDQLIALNESIENERSIIRIGDELTVTVPKPELSVEREELEYYEGTYEAPIQYVLNDDWYTTTEVTLQDPVSGYHKAVQRTIYLDHDVVNRDIIKEEIIAEAVPKIVEKGTKIPPTYIKPISGGRMTSGFGTRTATIRGMTSYHGAIDWGTPIGTSVVASCGGVVAHAGWMSGYGYCVFINHPDGKQTRYAHLSKTLVTKGQSVSQGQKIALSGNTGVSTGPHLHFEMRINGVMVNPLNYLN